MHNESRNFSLRTKERAERKAPDSIFHLHTQAVWLQQFFFVQNFFTLSLMNLFLIRLSNEARIHSPLTTSTKTFLAGRLRTLVGGGGKKSCLSGCWFYLFCRSKLTFFFLFSLRERKFEFACFWHFHKNEKVEGKIAKLVYLMHTFGQFSNFPFTTQVNGTSH